MFCVALVCVCIIFVFCESTPRQENDLWVWSKDKRLQEKSQWGYQKDNGPSNWPLYYSSCGGNRQSPIDIKTYNTILKRHSTELELQHYDIVPIQWLLQNTGHTVKLIGTWSNANKSPRIRGGPLGKHTYILQEIHFHFGSKNNQGSEHSLNKKSFPLEAHFVHYNQKYGSYATASTQPDDGLAVIGVFAKINGHGNPAFKVITAWIDAVISPETQVPIIVDTFSPRTLLPEEQYHYFSYAGSLTTPPCTETVSWIVMDTETKISNSQLTEFRRLRSSEANGEIIYMKDNFRPAQNLHGRSVLESFNEPDEYSSYSY